MMLSYDRRSRSRRRAALTVAVLLATMVVAPPAQAETTSQVRVIVELDGPAALAEVPGHDEGTAAMRARGWQRAQDRAGEIRAAQRDVLQLASGRGVDGAGARLLTAAFNGLVLEIPAAQVDTLRDVPGVRAVHPDETYTIALDDSVPLVGAPEVWDRTDPDGDDVTGAGVTVAVLDTGIDYRHPDLGGGFGPGHTVVGGYDFVHDDEDPMDDHGHGTHVAGIVAADGAVRGVAPDASLTAYKVLNQFGSGQLSDLLAALDEAVHPDNPHRADVVNMSLGGPGDGTDPLSMAAGQAAAAGVVVVAAAGNAGPWAHSVESPAAGDGVLAVGASASGVSVPRAHMVAPVDYDLRAVQLEFSADPPSEPMEVDLVDVGEGLPGGYDDVDVTGKAVLMQDMWFLGPELLFQQAWHAAERGAAAVFFYDPEFWGPVAGGPAPAAADAGVEQDAFATGAGDDRLAHTPALRIPGVSAGLLQEHLPGGDVRVQISALDATDLLPNFSASGPSWSFTHKPELVAPGVEILSTLTGGEHGRASGTSMAAPHVAGAAALLRQLRPGWEAAHVGAALANSAETLDDYDPLAQGAGRLDVAAAAATPLVATPPALSLGLADLSGDQLQGSATVTLSNLSDEPAELTLSVRQHDPAEAAVTLDQDAAQLAPGEQVAVEVEVALERLDHDADVTGWVVVDATGDGERDLAVPFLFSIRPMKVHVTPDPALTGTGTDVIVRSMARLADPPQVTVECPGLADQQPRLDTVSDFEWRGSVEVGDAGACVVHASGTATEHLGAPTLVATVPFEVVDPAVHNPGEVRWQPIGPNTESGRFAFSDDRHRVGVVSHRWPSLFVSEDRMGTWREQRTMPVAGGTPVAVEMDPHHDGTMYVGINGGGDIDRTYQGQVLVTDDNGDSWQSMPGRDSFIWAMALNGTGESLAVADHAGLRVTHNRGDTWQELAGNWSALRDLHWIGADLYVTDNNGLVRVAGAAGPEPADPEVVFRPGVLGWADRVTGDAETLLVSSFPFPDVYASHDGGDSFTQVLDSFGTSFQAMEMVGDDVYAVQASNLWVSRDRGSNWQAWDTPVEAAVEIDVGVWPQPHPSVSDQIYVSSSGSGIYSAGEPGEFERTGIPAAEVYALALADDGDGEALVAGTERDSFRTPLPRRAAVRPDDFEWQSTGFEGFEAVRAEFLATSPADPSVVYKLQRDPGVTFGIYRSLDGGVTWQRMASPTGQPTSLLVHPADPDRIYAGYGGAATPGLVTSSDGGETWHKTEHWNSFQALAGDPTDPDRLWAGDHQGLYLSEDAGLNFSRVADEPVTAIGIDPDDPQRMAVGGGALYLSEDGGSTLQPAGHVDLDMWISDIAFAADGTDRVFASTTQFHDEQLYVKGGRGVLVSGDGGASWASFSAGLDNLNVNALAISEDGAHLYAGTLGGGVHRIRISGPPGLPAGSPHQPPGPPR